MDHAFALNAEAAERYLLGEMTASERDDYEQHFFSCEECAEDVRMTAAFLANARPHLVKGGMPAAADTMSGEPRVATRRAPLPWRNAAKHFFWPLPAGAAAAAVLLLAVAGYQAAVVVPNLTRELQEAQRLQTAPWYFLSASRSEAPTVAVSDQDRRVGLTLSKSFDRPFPFFLCEIRDSSGRLVLSEVLPAPRAGDELQILVPTEDLSPGVYTVAIAGLESSSSRTPQSEYVRYQFNLRRDGGSTAPASPTQP
jgi:hypothetical protein